MKRRFTVLAIVLAAAAAFALLHPPAGAEPEGNRAAPYPPTSRIRVEIVKVVVPDGRDAVLPAPGGESVEALVPSDGPGLGTGWFAAVHTAKSLFEMLAPTGSAKVIGRGEVELTPDTVVSWNAGTEIPITSVQVKGDTQYETTTFQKTGFTAKLQRLGESDLFSVQLELKNVEAFAKGPGDRPVVFSGSTMGGVTLPDGYTSIFSFTDRVSGELLPETDAKVKSDRVVQYFVGITRYDLATGHTR